MTKNEEERIDPKLTYNPALQYFAQVVSHKIANPDDPVVNKSLPALNRTIEEYVKPDRQMFMEAEEEIEAFDEHFDL